VKQACFRRKSSAGRGELAVCLSGRSRAHGMGWRRAKGSGLIHFSCLITPDQTDLDIIADPIHLNHQHHLQVGPIEPRISAKGKALHIFPRFPPSRCGDFCVYPLARTVGSLGVHSLGDVHWGGIHWGAFTLGKLSLAGLEPGGLGPTLHTTNPLNRSTRGSAQKLVACSLGDWD